MRFLSFVVIALALTAALAGCGGAAPTETPPDPLALITTAAEKLRAAQTFRISVDQTGPDYILVTDYASVFFRAATAQYVAPGIMQASVRVSAAGLAISIDVFANGADQWYRAIWTGNTWLNQPFQADFNPATLISEESGFQAALSALIELTYMGATSLESGVAVHQLSATANGPDVTALLGGLIAPAGTVEVEVFIDRATGAPVRFVVREFESPYIATPARGQAAEPVVWTIDLFDFDAPAEIDTPEGA